MWCSVPPSVSSAVIVTLFNVKGLDGLTRDPCHLFNRWASSKQTGVSCINKPKEVHVQTCLCNNVHLTVIVMSNQSHIFSTVFLEAQYSSVIRRRALNHSSWKSATGIFHRVRARCVFTVCYDVLDSLMITLEDITCFCRAWVVWQRTSWGLWQWTDMSKELSHQKTF